MKNTPDRLSAPEISAIWKTYLQECASVCLLRHFLEHTSDRDIKPLLQGALKDCEGRIKHLTEIFKMENFPVPRGFSDEDVNLTAPPLFTDVYALSFVYRLGKLSLFQFNTFLTTTARKDVFTFFLNAQKSTTDLYKKALNLMLDKGIYDRPPKIDYPDKVSFVEKQSFLKGWFGDKRPINTLELGEMFYIIERNYIGLLLINGLTQVVRDEEIKAFLLRGKELAEYQIQELNQVVKKEGQFEIVPVNMEVTDSTISPFSDRLILFFITSTTAAGISHLGQAMSSAMRRDISAIYTKITGKVMLYLEDGANMMIDRGWMEQPPQCLNRQKLQKP